jgi:hypothetical protein
VRRGDAKGPRPGRVREVTRQQVPGAGRRRQRCAHACAPTPPAARAGRLRRCPRACCESPACPVTATGKVHRLATPGTAPPSSSSRGDPQPRRRITRVHPVRGRCSALRCSPTARTAWEGPQHRTPRAFRQTLPATAPAAPGTHSPKLFEQGGTLSFVVGLPPIRPVSGDPPPCDRTLPQAVDEQGVPPSPPRGPPIGRTALPSEHALAARSGGPLIRLSPTPHTVGA